jgi:hypothetical protein
MPKYTAWGDSPSSCRTILEVEPMDTAELLAIVIPLALIELGLLAWAIVDLVKRDVVRGGNKIVWAIIIVIFNIVGPIVYLAWGRQE